MTVEDDVRALAADVVNGALNAAFPQASLTELAAAARLMGLPSVFLALEAAQRALNDLADQVATAKLPMTDPEQFWAWYHEHAGTRWIRSMGGGETTTWTVARVPQLRKKSDGYAKPERWGWEFTLDEPSRRWSTSDTLRYPDRLLADQRRDWRPADPADLLPMIAAAELALHGSEPEPPFRINDRVIWDTGDGPMSGRIVRFATPGRVEVAADSGSSIHLVEQSRLRFEPDPDPNEPTRREP